MSKMSPEKRRFFIASMVISMLQMAMFAPTPGIQKISTEKFTDRSLADIQAAMMLPSIVALVMSIVSSFLIARRILSKKACVVIGIGLIGLTGVVVFFLHDSFWQLQLFSVLIGAGMGFLVAPLSSIMFDYFDEDERRLSMGVQSAFINGGAIILSVGGGLLAQAVWYGGYMMMLLAVPLVFVALKYVPRDRAADPAPAGAPKRKWNIPAAVLFYGVAAMLNALINNVNGTNISTHLDNARLGNAATAGVATAVQMAGGVVMGLFFNRISAKLKDFAMPLAFLLYAAGYTLISAGTFSLAVVLLGVFIAGMAMSLLVPQVLFGTSNCVNADNSAAAVALVNSVLPGIGGYLSPVVFTNLTEAIRPGSTVFRFAFVAGVALVVSAALALATYLRQKRGRPAQPEA